MSNQNPFLADDLVASIARDTQSVQSSQQTSLQAFLSTQNTQTIAQTKCPTKTKTPKPNLNFNLSHFMSYNFTHFTRFSIAGLSLFTVLAGGVATQAFGPEEFKPLTFLQQKTIKDFGTVKNKTETKVADNAGTVKNKITAEFCKTFILSHFEVGDGSSGEYKYDFSIASGKTEDSRLDFYSSQFFFTCRNQETRATYGESDRPIFNKTDLDSEICPSDYKGLAKGLAGVGGICLESYNIRQSNPNEIPFMSQSAKSIIKSDVQVLSKTYREREVRSEDKTYVFADNKGNDYELTVKNEKQIADKTNLQIDLK